MTADSWVRGCQLVTVINNTVTTVSWIRDCQLVTVINNTVTKVSWIRVWQLATVINNTVTTVSWIRVCQLVFTCMEDCPLKHISPSVITVPKLSTQAGLPGVIASW